MTAEEADASGPDGAVGETPEADQVARGWRVQLDRGLALRLPDERLTAAVDLASAEVLSDMQLFSQLCNLGGIKAALQLMKDNPAAARMIGEVDKLLETMFASSRFV